MDAVRYSKSRELRRKTETSARFGLGGDKSPGVPLLGGPSSEAPGQALSVLLYHE